MEEERKIMNAYEKNKTLLKITYAGLMAALCYVGYAIFPAINAGGTKIHIGNAFVVLGALFLGGLYGGSGSSSPSKRRERSIRVAAG